jgi:biotin transport system substrate-specific component
MKTIELVLCAFFAALSAILSQIMIPAVPVPLTLTHVSIFLAVGLLGTKLGTISQTVYVLTGAAGIPVFAGFTGGIGRIAGPTGGFIVGYIACAFISGLLIGRFGKSVKGLISAMYAGWAVTYIFGIIWFMFITETGVIASLSACVLPFLPSDAVKTIVSALLVVRLRPAVNSDIF